MNERLDAIVKEFDGKVEAADDLRGELWFRADREVCHGFIQRLRDDEELAFSLLSFVTCVDNYLDEPRFEVVYCVRSMQNNVDIRINAPVPGEDPTIRTITDLYPAANWMEREVYDMFGVTFEGHPRLERILTWDGFSGHPLRKDYPLLGNTPGTPGYQGKGGKL